MRPQLCRLTIIGVTFIGQHALFIMHSILLVSAATAVLIVQAWSAAPLLSIQRDGSNAVVNFTGRLQVSNTPEGPYTNDLGIRSPHTVEVVAASRTFWRSWIP